MKTQAAILVETGRPLEIADLAIPALKPGQVLVEVAYSGVCHTQLSEARGNRGADPYLPHCLGHEGSGHVLEVGAGVTRVRSGDAVLLSWIKGAGADVPGTVYDWNNQRVNAGGLTTFARHTVASENRVMRLPADFPVREAGLREAALLGCPVPTGIGAVWNTAQARPGQSLAVFGVGGVGCCAVAGASLAGCFPIIAVDIHPWKLALAQRFGATHAVQAAEAGDADVVARVAGIAEQLDFAVEVSGRPAVMQQALRAVRPRGGIAVVIGNARHGESLQIDPRWLNDGKQLRGTWGGDNVPERDYPRYLRLIQSGRLNLEPLLGKTYRLADVNQALRDLETGAVARPLLDMAC
jgi:S-(hydroxymethyl)glutathione dehydrogenase/alcohol dehydrogenase